LKQIKEPFLKISCDPQHLFSCNSKLINDITLWFSPNNFTQIS